VTQFDHVHKIYDFKVKFTEKQTLSYMCLALHKVLNTSLTQNEMGRAVGMCGTTENLSRFYCETSSIVTLPRPLHE
jgi:hypothetical protein